MYQQNPSVCHCLHIYKFTPVLSSCMLYRNELEDFTKSQMLQITQQLTKNCTWQPPERAQDQRANKPIRTVNETVEATHTQLRCYICT